MEETSILLQPTTKKPLYTDENNPSLSDTSDVNNTDEWPRKKGEFITRENDPFGEYDIVMDDKYINKVRICFLFTFMIDLVVPILST